MIKRPDDRKRMYVANVTHSSNMERSFTCVIFAPDAKQAIEYLDSNFERYAEADYNGERIEQVVTLFECGTEIVQRFPA